MDTINKDFKIFIDFDGTITKKDVGDAIFQEFGNRQKAEKIISGLLSDTISAKECWIQLCGMMTEFNVDEINTFIDNIEIDKTFPGFVDHCRNNNLDIFVLSDGFDYYIERIFKKENIKGVKVFCNRLIITEDKFIPVFPYLDENCRTSANCKRNHIINNSSDDDFTFYIVDGNSNKNPAQYFDFIFAKNNLLKFCERERISFFPYKDFNDIIARLEELRSKKRLKKRHQAVLKRREAYINE